MTTLLRPFAMGMVMAPLMLWMLHGALVGDQVSMISLGSFVAAHLGFAVLLVGVGVFASCLSPRVRRILDRIHLPSAFHLAGMLTGLVLSTGLVHFAMHSVG